MGLQKEDRMRTLFTLDKKDYTPGGSVFCRPSARAVIIQNGMVAMVYSQKYRYYKFPGGGIEAGERAEDALVREVAEETGLQVVRDSIREYGRVHRVQKGTDADIFMQDSDYYLCRVRADIAGQRLDDYEADEGFALVFLPPRQAIAQNRKTQLDAFEQVMLEREALVLEMLLREGYFAAQG